MNPLNYTTSIMSWQFIHSAINLLETEDNSEYSFFNFNLNAPTCIVLASISLEAFSNETSSLTNSFLFDKKKNMPGDNLQYSWQKLDTGVTLDMCKEVSEIQEDQNGSFYDQYKNLLKALDLDNPDFLQDLNHLKKLRHALVHYTSCDVPIVEGKNGFIQYNQEPPEVFSHLKKRQFKDNWPLISSGSTDGSVEWTLRISTDAMAVWSLIIVINSIIYVLNGLPEGRYKNHILKKYKARESSFPNIFEEGKDEINKISEKLYKKDKQ